MQEYNNIIDEQTSKPKYLNNMALSFLFGGAISLLGQILIEVYLRVGLDKTNAQSLMVVTLIFLAALLTGLGLYDKIGQYGKCGTIVPITGFANSMTSAAIEGKSEGIIQGVGVNLFKLAGCVITFGVVSAFVVATIKYLIWLV